MPAFQEEVPSLISYEYPAEMDVVLNMSRDTTPRLI
jgi:hypothetical protein